MTPSIYNYHALGSLRDYTRADVGLTAIGDVEIITDHVR
jgi:hypothetical protein